MADGNAAERCGTCLVYVAVSRFDRDRAARADRIAGV
jgi:hypothetical protein